MANGDFIDLLRKTASDKVFQVIRAFQVIGREVVYFRCTKRLVRIYSIIKDQCLFSQFSAKFTKRVYIIYFEGNNVFSNSQSSFCKGDCYVSQLLSVTHEIFKHFGVNFLLDTCGFFLTFLRSLIGFGVKH